MSQHIVEAIFSLGFWDYSAITVSLFGFWYFFLRKKNNGHDLDFNATSLIRPVAVEASHGGLSLADSGGFVAKMKSTGRHVLVFYGSQTGTAEDLANRLAKDAQRYGLQKGCIFATRPSFTYISSLHF